MVTNKHSSKIILGLMAAAIVLCFLAVSFSSHLSDLLGGKGVQMEYETALFDTDEIMNVDILMDDAAWDDMLYNAMAEEYYTCDVVVNGLKVRDVAIRPKGNTSLSAIAMDPTSDRYSLKLEFGHFVDGQTCYGLDKLILNNNYADATSMKEALIYDMYAYLDTDSSLYNYAKVSVNGEYIGVYLALEAVEESFMLRNYGTQSGSLYKPESLAMGGNDSSSQGAANLPGQGEGGMNFGNFDPGNFDPGNMDFGNMDFGNMDPSNMDFSNIDPGNMDFSQFPPSSGHSFGSSVTETEAAEKTVSEATSSETRSGGGFSRPEFDTGSMDGFSVGGNGGSNLNYTDDDPGSYSTIWEGEVTRTDKTDHRRVVTALKNISEGIDLETYLDVDNILKYMAVHVFAVNMDSLSGSMAHNYYLYEYNGQLNLLPWDYNLSFGGLSMGSGDNASSVINDAIDTPFSGTHFFDALLENEEYAGRYHAYLRQLVDEYVKGGRFDEVYSRFRSQIDEPVETDPTAFYTYDEYLTAVDIFYDTVLLRAESINGQLNGTIPSTDSGQKADSSSLIDASGIDISAMGEFNMGGVTGANADLSEDTASGGMPDLSNMSPGTPDFPGQSADNTGMKNTVTFAACFFFMLTALLILKLYKRRK